MCPCVRMEGSSSLILNFGVADNDMRDCRDTFSTLAEAVQESINHVASRMLANFGASLALLGRDEDCVTPCLPSQRVVAVK